MLCCLGFFVNFAIGSIAGGPWILIASIMGFSLGFLGDMKLMRGGHGGCSTFIRSSKGGKYACAGEKTEDANGSVYDVKVDEKQLNTKQNIWERLTISAARCARKSSRRIHIST